MENFWGAYNYPNIDYIENKIKDNIDINQYYYLNNDDINNKIESSIKQQWNTNQGFGNWKIYYSMGVYFYLINEIEFLLKKENRKIYLLNNIIKPKLKIYVYNFLEKYYSPPDKLNDFKGGKGYQIAFNRQINNFKKTDNETYKNKTKRIKI